ncbi:MAG TPA: DUF427 domain-containing protein [Miltoncostaea sp.]|nr:DUF427 domain-containing protein [Miltoncostaea sp.]
MSTTPGAAARGRVRVETGRKRIRALLGGRVVVDTVRPLLVWEVPYYPAYYLPLTDLRAELVPADDAAPVHSPSRGDGRRFSVMAGDVVAHGAALRFAQSPFAELRDAVRLDWDAMDAWFEEDEEVFTHPRDPYTRVDILPSSRHVRVEVGGVTVAESSSPRLLFETGLPPRHYLPKPHVRMDLLTHTVLETHCPYKGRAEYWSVRAGGVLEGDVAWSYPAPLPESQKIAGLVCFYDERVDIHVDGVLQERPVTKFS